jgi:hypothetical protein
VIKRPIKPLFGPNFRTLRFLLHQRRRLIRFHAILINLVDAWFLNFVQIKVLTDPVRGVSLGGFFPSPGSLSLFSFVAVLLFGSVNLGYINGHILDVIVDVVSLD